MGNFSFLTIFSLQTKLPTSEIAAIVNEFRSRHLAELTEVSLPFKHMHTGMDIHI